MKGKRINISSIVYDLVLDRVNYRVYGRVSGRIYGCVSSHIYYDILDRVHLRVRSFVYHNLNFWRL